MYCPPVFLIIIRNEERVNANKISNSSPNCSFISESSFTLINKTQDDSAIGKISKEPLNQVTSWSV